MILRAPLLLVNQSTSDESLVLSLVKRLFMVKEAPTTFSADAPSPLSEEQKAQNAVAFLKEDPFWKK